MALRRKAFLAVLAALAAFALIRRAFPAGRRVTIRSSRNSDVDSSNCALLANGTRGFLSGGSARAAFRGSAAHPLQKLRLEEFYAKVAKSELAPFTLAASAANAKPRALPPLLRPLKPI